MGTYNLSKNIIKDNIIINYFAKNSPSPLSHVPSPLSHVIMK